MSNMSNISIHGQQDAGAIDQTNNNVREMVLRRLVAHGWCESPSILALTSKRFQTPAGRNESVIAYVDIDPAGNLVLRAIDHFSKENNFKSCATTLATDLGLGPLHVCVDLFNEKVDAVCAQLVPNTGHVGYLAA
jgi:hypothetical protein